MSRPHSSPCIGNDWKPARKGCFVPGFLRAEALTTPNRRIPSTLAGDAVPLELKAAAGGGDSALRSFDLVAYNGGALELGWGDPVYVDLAGMATANQLPVLKGHNPNNEVGHTNQIDNNGSSLSAAGVLSSTANPESKRIAEAAANGFKWQVSIGAQVLRAAYLDAEEQTQVNGRTVTGPAIIVRASRLAEISIVAMGADNATSAVFAAGDKADGSFVECIAMGFEAWLKAKGFDAAKLTDAQKTSLQAMYDAEVKAQANPAAFTAAGGNGTPGTAPVASPIQAAANPAANVPATLSTGGNDVAATLRASAAAELRRQADLSALCPGGSHPALLAQAIGENWTPVQLEVAILRAERTQSATPAIHSGGVAAEDLPAVLEASLARQASLVANLPQDRIDATYPERIRAAADRPENRNVGLCDIVARWAHSQGLPVRYGSLTEEMIRAALQRDRQIMASGGFGIHSLSGILGNVANKALVATYQAVNVIWPKFAAVRSNKDFKATTRYRLDSTGAFKKVGQDGELKHIALSNSSFSTTLDTYGCLVALTRQMWINDDLGAFLDMPIVIGRAAAIRPEEAFWVMVLGNANNFFHANNRNLTSGGSSALSIDSLTTLSGKFAEQVDASGKPILAQPKRLAVGTALYPLARQLYTSTSLNNGSTSDKPMDNPHAGLYEPFQTPYLNSSNIKDQDGTAISGTSTTQWYMTCDPAILAPWAMAFLNGNQIPTLQSAETDFSTLGMQWRCFWDFAVGQEDPNGAQKSAGA